MSGVAAAKKGAKRKSGAKGKKAKRGKKAPELPTIYVDVDDEAAIGEMAETLVAAILAAAAGRAKGPSGRGKARKGAKK